VNKITLLRKREEFPSSKIMSRARMIWRRWNTKVKKRGNMKTEKRTARGGGAKKSQRLTGTMAKGLRKKNELNGTESGTWKRIMKLLA
jgi:hypothetical protein